jgi:hypothetical protein
MKESIGSERVGGLKIKLDSRALSFLTFKGVAVAGDLVTAVIPRS